MSGRRDIMERIASALERIAPNITPPTDWSTYPAYMLDGDQTYTLDKVDALPLEQLRGIDEQKQAVLENLSRLASGSAAHDMLLWGARGMGKSVLVRSASEFLQSKHPGSLALLQVTHSGLARIPQLIEALAKEDRAFLLFMDDLGFHESVLSENLALRSLLDGGVVSRPSNVRLAVTSNRRAIVQRSMDLEQSLHERDDRDHDLALADRFGLTLAFHPCDQETYLEIIGAYVEPIGLDFDATEAIEWAIFRGNRSGRTAYQFACELAGRAGKAI